MNSDNSKRQRLEGDQSASTEGDNSSSFGGGFGVSSSSSSPFGATGSDSPFGSSGEASPFGTTESANDSSPFGASGNGSPFGAGGSDSPFGATGDNNPFGSTSADSFGTSNPFGAAPAAPAEAADPFTMASGFGSNDTSPFGAASTEAEEEAVSPPSHVVPNPFGGMSLGQQQDGMSNAFGATAAAPAEASDPFAMGSGFGSTGTSPFGAAPTEAEDVPPPSHVVPNPFGGMSLGQQQDEGAPEAQPQEDSFPAHNVVPNPFAAAAPSDDPFAIGNDAAAPGHVVANPFGAAPAPPQDDPFAFGGGANDDGPGHIVANPFGAAPPQEDPFAFGNVNYNEDAAAPPAAGGIFAGFGAAVANLNPFGGAPGGNPFGIANFGPFGGAADNEEVNEANDAELDLSQHSLGETFLAGHMNRISQERSMRLTEEEQRWTKELRDAVNASTDITPKLNDMEIASQAIANDGHVMNALIAIKALQEFRRTYEIDDTPQQGLECLRALFDQQDGMFLEIESNPQTHECSMVVDVREYDPSKALRIVEGKPAGHSWQVLMRGYYYLSRVLTPSLASVRHGVMLTVDCDGVGWNNFNQEVENQSHAELIRHLPLNYNRTMAYSTAMVTSMWWGFTKRLWQDKFINALETGCRLVDTDPSTPPRRIADMYRQPDLATVTRRMERQIVDLLNTRETNEEDFSLESQQERQAAAAEVSAR